MNVIYELIKRDKLTTRLVKLNLKSFLLKLKGPNFKKDKNILILVRSLSNGGAEKVMVELANNLAQKYNVILVASDIKNADYECNIKMIEIPGLTNKKIYREKLRDIKKEYNITHSISCLTTYNYLNVVSKYKDKTIVTVHNMISLKQLDKEKIRKLILTNKFANKIVAVSKEVRHEQINIFDASRRKIKTIYNCFDIDNINTKSNKKKIKDKRLINSNNLVFTAGRLNHQKGQWYLIRAFSLVVKKIPNAKLCILGRGEEESYLRELIEKLKLQDSVYLLGFKKNIYDYLKLSKVFIITSIYEGLSNVIIEAMACKVPIISTDCSAGPRELLAPSTNFLNKTKEIEYAQYGILVPKMDGKKYSYNDPLTKQENMVAQSLIEMLTNSKLQNEYRKKSYERAKNFDKNIILKKWDNLIK